MSAHTPGPWRWSYHAIPSEPFAIVTSDGQKDVLLATDTNEGRVIIECSEADMQLIRSAPDLLMALKELSARVDGWHPTNEKSVLTLKARVTIDKAEGRA